MYLNFTSRYTMLDSIDSIFTYGALHTAYDTGGGAEVTGGGYARQPLVWTPATGFPGFKLLGTPLPTWSVPATTILYMSFWNAVTGGTFGGNIPVGGTILQHASTETSTDITNNDIFSNQHNLAAGDNVVFWGSATALPTGLLQGIIYYVIASGLTTNSFRVSATSGGAAVDLTSTPPFAFYLQRCVPAVLAVPGTYSLTALQLDMNAVAS